jgi:hypothetical protein
MSSDSLSLQWLVGDALVKADFFRESESWLLTFGSGSTINIACLWRLKENGRIVATGYDHGHVFGLPAPFDSSLALVECIRAEPVSLVHVQSGATDLKIGFGPRYMLEVLPVSAGYESWQATSPKHGTVYALGNGELCTFNEA